MNRSLPLQHRAVLPCPAFPVLQTMYRVFHHLEKNSWILLSFCFTWALKNLGDKIYKHGWWFVWSFTARIMDGSFNISLFPSIPGNGNGCPFLVSRAVSKPASSPKGHCDVIKWQRNWQATCKQKIQDGKKKKHTHNTTFPTDHNVVKWLRFH